MWCYVVTRVVGDSARSVGTRRRSSGVVWEREQQKIRRNLLIGVLSDSFGGVFLVRFIYSASPPPAFSAAFSAFSFSFSAFNSAFSAFSVSMSAEPGASPDMNC